MKTNLASKLTVFILILCGSVSVASEKDPKGCGNKFYLQGSEEEVVERLSELQLKFREAASEETAFDKEIYRQAQKSGKDRLTQHCGCVVYSVWRLYGGKLMSGYFVSPDGAKIWHFFNRLMILRNGVSQEIDVDLTRGQFDLSDHPTALSPKSYLIDIAEFPIDQFEVNARILSFRERFQGVPE